MPSEFENLQNQLASYDDEVNDLYSSADRFLYDYELANYRNYRDDNPLHDQRNKLELDDRGFLKEDSDWTKSLKSKYNSFVSSVFDAGDSYQFDIYDNGRVVSGANKNYDASGSANAFDEMDDNEFIAYAKNVEEDPNAQNVLYSYKQYAGKDKDGNDQYNYKVGYAKAGAWDRVKGNFASQGIELLWDKRFGGAEEYENSFHKRFISNIAVDKGNNKSSGLNFNDGYTELYQKDLLGVDENQSRDDTYANAEKSLQSSNEYWKKHTGSDSVIDAFQYGAVRLGGDLIDVGSTSLGYVLEKLGAENSLEDNIGDTISDNAAKWVGYDTQAQTEATREAIAAWNRGDYFDAVFNDLGAKGNTMVESLPEMILMTGSLGAGAGVKAASLAKKFSSTEKALKVAEATGDIAKVKKYTSELNSLKTALRTEGADIAAVETLANQSTFTSLAKEASTNFGFKSVWAKNTNNVIEERMANGDDDISLGEFTAIAASQYFLTGLDKVAFDDIIKSTQLRSAFKSAYDAVKGTSYEKSVLGKIYSTSIGMAEATGKEGVQEYLQTWGEILGKDVGVDGKTFVESYNDKENQDEAIGAMAMGAGAGFVTHATASTGSYAMSSAGKALGTINMSTDNKLEDAAVASADLAKSVGRASKDSAKYLASKIAQTTDPEKLKVEVEKTYKDTLDKFGENLTSDMKEKIARDTASVIRQSKHPKEVKRDMLEALFASDSLSDDEKSSFFNKFAQDAIRDVVDLYKAESRGSDISSDVESDVGGLLDSATTDNKVDTLNPVKGKLGGIIDSIDIAIEDAEKQGIDSTDLKKARAVVNAYNTSDVFEKSLDSVGSEVDIVGFVGDTGSILKPSLKQYEANLIDNVRESDDGFASSEMLAEWAKERKNKLRFESDNGTPIRGVYNFVAQTGDENIRAANLARNVLSTVKDIDPNEKENLENAIRDFEDATVSDATKFINSKFSEGNKVQEKTMDPDEAVKLRNEIRSAKTANDANRILFSINNGFSDPQTANEFMKMYAGIISGKGNPLQTGSGKTARDFIREIESGTFSKTDIVGAINSGTLKGTDDELEYLSHRMNTRSSDVIQSIPEELEKGVVEAKTVDEVKLGFANIINNNALSYKLYKKLRDLVAKRVSEIEQKNSEPGDSNGTTKETENNSANIVENNSNAENYKNIQKQVEQVVTSESKNNSKENNANEGDSEPSGYSVGEYDTRSIDAEIREFEYLKQRLNDMTKDDKNLSDADRVVLKNVKKSIEKQLRKVDEKIKKYERAKERQEKGLEKNKLKNIDLKKEKSHRGNSSILANSKQAVLDAIDALKKSLKKIKNTISKLMKKRDSLKKVYDIIDAYESKGKVDIRSKKRVIDEIDNAIESTKEKKKELENKLNKESEESLRKKLKEDVKQSRKGNDSSSLRSSAKNKLMKLASIYQNQVKKIRSDIESQLKKLDKIDKATEYAKTSREKLEDAYDKIYNRYKESLEKKNNSVEKNKNTIMSEQKRISDLQMNLTVLAGKLKNGTIGKKEFDKQANKIEKRVKQHNENIAKHIKYINEIEDRFGDTESRFITRLRQISSKLNDDRDGSKQRKKILELEEKRRDIEAKTKEYVNKAMKELGNNNDVAVKVFLDIATVESSNKLRIESSLNAKISKPNDVIKDIKTAGSQFVEEVKNDNIKAYMKEKKTVLSRLGNLFNATKEQLLAWAELNKIDESVVKSVVNVSKYMHRIDDIKIIESTRTEVDNNGKIFHTDGKDFVSSLSAIGVESEQLKDALKFGTVMALMSYSSVKNNIASMDTDDISKDFGIDNVSAMKLKTMAFKGFVPMRTLESEVKSVVMSRLGIKFNSNIDIETSRLVEAGIEASIGANLNGLVIENDAGEIIQENVTGKNMHMVQIDTEKMMLWKEYKEDYSNIQYINEGSKRLPPKRMPYKVKENDTLINSFIKLDDKHKKDIEKNNETEMFFADTTEDFVKEYKKDKKQALKQFGYVELTNDMTIDEMKLQKAHNEKYEREADALVKHYESMKNQDGTVSSFYIPWGVTKSERMTIKSDLNVQESKIHRTFVISKDYKSKLDTRPGSKRLVDEIAITEELSNTEMFEVFLAQSFGMDPDKNSKYNVFKSIRSRIDVYGGNVSITYKDGESEWKALSDYVKGIGEDSDNLATIFHKFEGAHSVMAAKELRKLNRTSDTASFETVLYGEADGITSGPALLNMKVLGDHQLKMLEKAGIYTDKSKQRLERYAKFLLSKKHGIHEDLIELSHGSLVEAGKYHMDIVNGETETLKDGEIIVKRIEIDGDKYDAFLDLYTTVGQYSLEAKKAFESRRDKDGKTNFDKLSAFAKRLYGMVFEEGTLSELRFLSKDPTMTFGYGAMISSIQRALTWNSFIKAIRDKMKESKSIDILKKAISDSHVENLIVSYRNSNKKDPSKDDIESFKRDGAKLANEYVSNTKNYSIYDKDRDIFREPTDVELSRMIEKNEQYKFIEISDDVHAMVHSAYGRNTIGSFYKHALNKAFGEISDMRNAFKATDLLVSSVFNAKLKVKLDAIRKKNGSISKKKYFEEVIKLHESGFGHSLDNGETRQPLYKTDNSIKSNTRDFERVVVNGNEYFASVTPDGLTFKSNSGAAVTISIHSLDGSVMQESLKNNDFTNIYDAIIVGAVQSKITNATDIYNTEWVTKSLERQDFKLYKEKADKMVSSMTEDELDAFFNLTNDIKVVKKNVSVTEGKTNRAPVYVLDFKEKGKAPKRVLNKRYQGKTKYIMSNDGENASISINDSNGVNVARIDVFKDDSGQVVAKAEVFAVAPNGMFMKATKPVVVPLNIDSVADLSVDDAISAINRKVTKDTKTYIDTKNKTKEPMYTMLTKTIAVEKHEASIEPDGDWGFLGHNLLSIPFAITHGKNVVNEGIRYFNKNVNKIFSNQMFVAGTGIVEVNIAHTKKRPREIEDWSDDFKAMYSGIIKLYGTKLREFIQLDAAKNGLTVNDINAITRTIDFEKLELKYDINDIEQQLVHNKTDSVKKAVSYIESLLKQERLNLYGVYDMFIGKNANKKIDDKKQNIPPIDRVKKKFKAYFEDKTKGCL